MTDLQEAEHLLTTQQLADWLQIPIMTVRQWRSDRTGPPGYRVGRHVRYRREDVEAWLEQRSDAAKRKR